ncbi:MAG: hypothetical protein ACLPKB_13060 [Xanthobacteraceae bacterium]
MGASVGPAFFAAVASAALLEVLELSSVLFWPAALSEPLPARATSLATRGAWAADAAAEIAAASVLAVFPGEGADGLTVPGCGLGASGSPPGPGTGCCAANGCGCAVVTTSGEPLGLFVSAAAAVGSALV